MSERDTFEILFLIARPAAGKSETIACLKQVSEDERQQRFHIGRFRELDDFPMLWAWFEEDSILTRMGHPRLHTDDGEYFLHPYLWHVLIERLALDYHKMRRDLGQEEETAIIEFSRGSEHGGYREAFQHFPEEMLRRGAILYIQASYAESLRKNRRRYNPDRPDSILEHGLSDEKIKRLYQDDDWEEFSSADPQYVTVKGVRVPYAVFGNEDDVTTEGGEPLEARLEETLGSLWRIYRQ